MSTLLNDLEGFFVDNELVGDTDGFTLFKSMQPPDPDKTVTVYETPGRPPSLEKDGSGGSEMDEPGFQVRVRGAENGYEEASQRIYLIYNFLHGATFIGASGKTYLWVHASQSGPLPLGRDEMGRPELTWNFTTYVDREVR